MGIFLFANNATTTLGSSVAPSDGTVTVATGTGALFPSPTGGDKFTLTLSEVSNPAVFEICYCTGRTVDLLTVSRGQEGTSAGTFSVGDIASNRWTAGSAGSFIQIGAGAALSDVQQQAGNYAVDSGAANAGVVALSPAPVSLPSLVGSPIRVKKIGSANTGAYTLDFGYGAKNVKFPDGTALIGGELPASGIFEVFWDGTNLQLLSVTDQIALTRLAQIATLTFLSNLTGGPAEPSANSAAAVAAALAPDLGSRLGSCYFTTAGGVITSQTGANLSAARTGAGLYTMTLGSAAPNTTYCVQATKSDHSNGDAASEDSSFVRTTTQFGLAIRGGSGLADPPACNVTVFPNP